MFCINKRKDIFLIKKNNIYLWENFLLKNIFFNKINKSLMNGYTSILIVSFLLCFSKFILLLFKSMAAPITIASDFIPQSSTNSTKSTTIKKLSESGLTSIPPSFVSETLQDLSITNLPEAKIPIIDFSILTFGNPEQRSTIIQDLGKACEEWGFFLVRWNFT